VLQIIYSEFPHKKFNRELYYKNQKSIRRVLDAPKAFHAYYSDYKNDTLVLQLGSIDALPSEIIGIFLGDSMIARPFQEIILPSKQPKDFFLPEEYAFQLLPGKQLKNKNIRNLQVRYRIPGAQTEKLAEVFPYPFKDKKWLNAQLMHQSSDLKEFPFLLINEQQKIIFIKPGKWSIEKDLIFPAGYTVKAAGNTHIDILNSALVISYSALDFRGEEEAPVTITSTDNTGKGIFVVRAPSASVLNYVHFRNLSAAAKGGLKLTGSVTFYESDVKINYCWFSGGNNEDALNIVRSAYTIENSLFENLKNDGVDIKFSEGKITGTSFLNCDEDGIDITSGNVLLKNIQIINAGNKGINLKAHARATAENISIKDSYIAVSAEDYADFSGEKINISGGTYGFVAYQNKPEFGPATVSVNGFTFTGKDIPHISEKKSVITLDGKKLTGNTGNAEKIIKAVKHEQD
jgi:hypothetical protein